MGTMGTASSGRYTNTGWRSPVPGTFVVMVQMLLSVGLTDGIESSFGVGLTDGIYSVGSHWSVLHTFDERLRVDCVVCLSVLLCVGCTNGICVAILASRICVTIPFAMC